MSSHWSDNVSGQTDTVKLQAGNYSTNTAGADRRPAAVFYKGFMSWSQLPLSAQIRTASLSHMYTGI